MMFRVMLAFRCRDLLIHERADGVSQALRILDDAALAQRVNQADTDFLVSHARIQIFLSLGKARR